MATDGPPQLPELVYAQASPRSRGGASLFGAGTAVTADSAAAYTCEEAVTTEAASRLREAGFQVLQVAAATVNIAGPPQLFAQVFGTRLVAEEREVIKGGARQDTATFVECPDTDLPGLIDTAGSPLGDVLEGVAIEQPRYFHARPLPFPPPKGYWHLRVPGDVSRGLAADPAHRQRFTGRGVRVVMTDSGWSGHPYFAARGYRTNATVLGPGTSRPGRDENGHGTAESANLFAAAPDVDYTMVKMSFVNTTGAFNTAAALDPDVISNSWGSDIRTPPLSAADQALAAAIALAVAGGIVVVFSAGNGHYGFPGQHPDVVAAGGVYLDRGGGLRASDYASGFASRIYAGRRVPDVCGLVGQRPRAAYIALPLPPGCAIDLDLARGGPHPDGDETAPDDGWAMISGTSAAAPQIAGVCALLRQANSALTPAQCRRILRRTARDVTSGTNANGNTATAGPDLATGHGLVNAHKAVISAVDSRA